MTATNVISIRIFQDFVEATEPRLIHSSTSTTNQFPPAVLKEIIVAVTGHFFEEDDYNCANGLHVMGYTQFKFGSDWQYWVEAKVEE